MKKSLLTLITFFLISSTILLSQFGQEVYDYSTKEGKKNAFIGAEAYVLFEEYKEGRFKENQAPADAYFYLGHAYRVTNQLDFALAAYQKFKEILNPEVYDEVIVEEQMQACRNATKLQEKPLFVEYENLGPIINSRFPDINPVISGDQKAIVYVQAQQFGDFVFNSKYIDGEWSPPYNMTFDLGAQDIYSSSLSYDGTILYLYKLDNYDGNIYVSRFSDNRWSPAEKLNDNINTKFWESHASISSDGQSLFFTSNRKDGFGALDIYRSEKDTTGNWGHAINLGPKINTPYNEESPFISLDGKTLYFSSYGHYNMGGYDIFYSNLLENNEWSAPLNMGYPINTPDDDLFYVPLEEDFYAFYSKFPEEGYGEKDIFRLEIFSDEHPRNFLVRGIISQKELGRKIDSTFIITILKAIELDTVTVIQPDVATGEYEFELIKGDYEMIVEGEGFEPKSEFFSLVYDQKESKISLPKTELVLKDIIAELEIGDNIYTVDNNDPVKMELSVEKNSKLTINAFLNTSLINSDEFEVKRKKIVYKYTPVKGKNILKLKLVDKFGNINEKEILVDYIPKPVIKPLVAISQVKPDIVVDVQPEAIMTPLVELTLESETIPTDDLKEKSKGRWIIWMILPVTILIFILIILKRQKKNKD
ncbi:hypothetical protein ES708_07808 [subsurface metagenome]